MTVDTDRPILLPCHGVSRRGVHAEDVAGELASRGLAEVVDDIEAIVDAAREGRVVLALDACAASCQARLLDARGVETVRTLNLTASEVETSEELEAASGPVKRVRRPAPVPAAPSPGRAHSLDDYLLVLDRLTTPVVECGVLGDSPTLAAHVAQALGVSRPTAGEMLARLEESGHVRRGAHKDVLLTVEGRAAADEALRRQRILERFATDVLGYPVPECYERAREISAGFDGEALERVWDALGRPERCPHGWPVDPVEARQASRDLLALSAAPPGEACVVEQLDEASRERLEAIDACGLRIGSRVARVRTNEAAGVVELEAEGRPKRLGAALATGVFVRPL